MDPTDVSYLFKDFRPFLGQCRFNNCIHDREPDCAVRRAVEEGKIQQGRYESYKQILEELKSGDFRR
jgi:ribosome biogenesis GTPase